MYSDDRKRSIYKTISWRILAVLVTFTITYIWTGEIAASIILTLILNSTKTIIYYIHERVWNKIKFGKTNSK